MDEYGLGTHSPRTYDTLGRDLWSKVRLFKIYHNGSVRTPHTTSPNLFTAVLISAAEAGNMISRKSGGPSFLASMPAFFKSY